jgi:2-keto-4-pentenoate hydratase
VTAPADPNRALQAARQLVAVRAGAPRLAALPAALAPTTLPEAYAIQHEVLHLLGTRAGGWKATLFDARHGICAPLPANALLASPAHLPASSAPTAGSVQWGIEPEIAFRIGHALPPLPGGAPYSSDAVLSAVASAHAVLEVVVSRYVDSSAVSQLERVADNFMNEALVIGPPCTGWRALTLPTLSLRVQVDDREVYSGVGGHPLGDPLVPLVWIANHLAALGGGLQDGDIVTTGSCNGLRMIGAGQEVRATFAGLGTATLSFQRGR